jgi:diguanylate cyclase (GGDEF)-like protein/PAS domain S-box-containing protein
MLHYMQNILEAVDSYIDVITPSRRSTATSYSIALALIIGALSIRFAIAPTEAGLPFLTFFPAVTLAVLLGGLGPGLFALITCSILASWMFIPPFNSSSFTFNSGVIWVNIVFWLEGIAVIAVVEAMYRQRSNYVNTSNLLAQLNTAKQELQLSASLFDVQESIMITDAKGVIQRVNQAFTESTGYSAEEVLGKTPRILQSGRHDATFYAEMWECIRRTGNWQGEIWDKRKNGEIYPKLLTITAIKAASGTVTHYIGSHIDITERKATAEQIKRLVFYDTLTGLPNRRMMLDLLHHAFASSQRSGREGALLFIDLDNFKVLNDTLGHDIGDVLLKQVAQRLQSGFGEVGTFSRLSGDEFLMILEDLSEHPIEAAAQTQVVGEKILAILGKPYQLGPHEFHCTASIGAAIFSDHKVSYEELLKRVDIAMCQAKLAGRNTLRFFNNQMQEIISARASLEKELRKALENHQLHLHYQIQVDSSANALGAEALIRWIHPERGLVSPVQFIPLAEETGLILPIGQWVLETACNQLKIWEQEALTRALILSVNVSAKQFRQVNFVANVKETVLRHAINPKLLKLELTESMLLDNIKDIINTMSVLKEFGVGFSLDDFGTGYSSLQYLKRLPIDQLKIDQSFVRDLVTDNDDKAIVRTIIAMAHSLKLNVIAEGVETEDQRQILLAKGCTNYQGYFFGKPMPIEQFGRCLINFRTL